MQKTFMLLYSHFFQHISSRDDIYSFNYLKFHSKFPKNPWPSGFAVVSSTGMAQKVTHHILK